MLKADVSPEAAEAGIRAMCSMAPAKASTALHKLLLDHGIMPCTEKTLPTVMQALARAGEGAGFAELLASVEAPIVERSAGQDCSHGPVRQDMLLLNIMLRSLARLDVDKAVAKVATLYKRGIVIESATYGQLAAKSMEAGKFEQAEELLEMRDYL